MVSTPSTSANKPAFCQGIHRNFMATAGLLVSARTYSTENVEEPNVTG
jgi:hypothetical protein